MGAKPGEPRPRRNEMTAAYRPTHGENPVRVAYENGIEFGKATCYATGDPFVPKEYDRKTNLLCYVAYRNGVTKGRVYGQLQSNRKKKVKEKGRINGDNQPVLNPSGSDRTVCSPVPAAEIRQRSHPSIRPSGVDDSTTGSGRGEQGGGKEGGEGVGEVVPTA